MRWRFAGVVFLSAAMSLVRADKDLKSGPQVEDLLPGSFAPYNINGKFAGRYHCLVCQHDFNPVVMVFARDPTDGKDEALAELLKKLDNAVERHQNAHLGSFVVILSPAAKSAATDAAKEEDTDKLVAQTAAREALIAKLKAQSENLKSVVVAAFPSQGPRGYKINGKAEVTVIFYERYKVLANFTFANEELQSKDVETIIKKVDDVLGKDKKKARKTKPLAA